MNEVLASQQELVEEFRFFDNWIDRYQYLIDLGRRLPEFPEADKIVETLKVAYSVRLVGEPGAGKSVCAYQAARTLKHEGWRMTGPWPPGISTIPPRQISVRPAWMMPLILR